MVALLERMQLGRIFRRMGLPFWTFIGIGIAGWWFDSAATLVQQLITLLFSGQPLAWGEVWQPLLPPLTMFLIPCGIVVCLGLYYASRRQLTEAGFQGGLQYPEPKRGLILLVSNPLGAQFSIQWHFNQGTLERVWLLPSDDSETEKFGASSLGSAKQIRAFCQELCAQANAERTMRGEPLRSLQVEIYTKGVSPADAQDTFDQVNRIFRRSGYPPQDLIADFTGGTKPMAVGMIMACLPQQRELEYVPYNATTKQSYGPFLIDYQHSAFDMVG
jgi:hypothetical protein